MAYLVDTNVLLRSIQPHQTQHREAVDAVARLLESGERVYVVPQIIGEFWNVCTRPSDKNGIGRTPREAEVEVKKIEALLKILPETPSIFEEWRKLVTAHSVSGVEVHDARIVAAMKVHDITHILTFNERIFGVTSESRWCSLLPWAREGRGFEPRPLGPRRRQSILPP